MAMRYLQKLGKALMMPVACLPICGILMGLGYILCPEAMQGGEVAGLVQKTGFFMIKAGSALIDNIAILFVIGVGVGMSRDNDGVGGLAALASWLIITTLLSPAVIKVVWPAVVENQNVIMAFEKVPNPFTGILSGIIGSLCYNRFMGTKLPDWLAFFSGKRCVTLVAGLVSLVVALVLLFIWPVVFTGMIKLGNSIAGMGAIGAGIYATLNRLLIPTGLHHALNNVFWFDTIGLGDLSHFWKGETSADVSWSLGMYMSGFFPCMIGGIMGAALAMIHCAAPEKRKQAIGILLSTAICAFVCGVTEPFEFSFMFLAPLLYVAYAVLYGIFTTITVMSGFRAGFCFSAGVTDLIFSSTLPAAQKTWLIVPLALGAFVTFYLVFRLAIKFFDLATPGRGQAVREEDPDMNDHELNDLAVTLLGALGGPENLVELDHCITRLRLEVKDDSKVNEDIVRKNSRGIIRPGKGSVQIVIGPKVQFVFDALKAVYKRAPRETVFGSPAKGEYLAQESIPDGVFSEGVLGPCCAVVPSEGSVYAPADGTVSSVAETLHAVCLTCDGAEVLVHMGIDTVKLNGQGFKVLVKEGDAVRKGQPLAEMDLQAIKEAGYETAIVIAVTNPDDLGQITFAGRGPEEALAPIIKISKEK